MQDRRNLTGDQTRGDGTSEPADKKFVPAPTRSIAVAELGNADRHQNQSKIFSADTGV